MTVGPPPAEELAVRLRGAEGVSDVVVQSSRRLSARLNPAHVRAVLLRLRDAEGCWHLSAISGVDTRASIEVVYHVSWRDGVVLSLKAAVPRDEPRIDSVVDVMPAANLYERQAHDLLGVVFVGHPDLRRILLNEDWPADEYPLRKDWKPDPKKRYGGPATGGDARG